MTGKDYIDEIKLRLMRLGISKEANDPLILSYINEGRRAVQQATMYLYPERYGKIARIAVAEENLITEYVIPPNASNKITDVWRVAMPDDFIRANVVIVEWLSNVGDNAGVTYRTEARRMDKRELYNIQAHSWNVPTIWDPAYAVEKSTLAGTDWYIYIAGLNYDVQTLFDIAATVVLEVWYVAALNDIEYTDSEITIPPQIEELTVHYALYYLLQKMFELDAATVVMTDIVMLQQSLQMNYEIEKAGEKLFLATKGGPNA